MLLLCLLTVLFLKFYKIKTCVQEHLIWVLYHLCNLKSIYTKLLVCAYGDICWVAFIVAELIYISQKIEWNTWHNGSGVMLLQTDWITRIIIWNSITTIFFIYGIEYFVSSDIMC